MMELQTLPLPSGWDCRLDQLTGKTYFINHFTKTTTWDDPRLKNAPFNKQMSQHLQQSTEVVTQHGSPDLRRNYVYPSQSSPKPAFQIPGQNSPKYIPLQDLKNNAKMSPLLLRTSQTQDSSLNIPDTEESVAKISAMFPTVSDTHIRLLLKKYHGREAVVISALQVQKHPITTPGPFATPPPSRNMYPGLHSSLQMTPPLGFRSYSRGSSPVTRFGSIPINTNTDSPRIGDGFRNSSRPHSSPKLKLRYMKCIFPKAEETVILDVLTNSDNNIQKASDWLKRMGYERKDPVKLQQQAEEAKLEEERQKNKEISEAEVPQLPKIKTTEEKTAIKERLHEDYKDLVEQVITIALDSVQYDEERAKQILQIMMEEDNKTQSSSSCKSEEPETSTDVSEADGLAPGTLSTSQSRQSVKSLLNNDKNDGKNRNTNESSYKSTYLSNYYGANPENVIGANDKLLLKDYIPVRGWNVSLRNGPQAGLAKGPNKNNLISNKTYIACGPNSQMCKGPKPGLAKGSIFQHLRNIVNSESRGK